MPRDADAIEIASLVARAEKVKRNRETILRTHAKPLTTSASRSVVISPDHPLGVYLRVSAPDPDSETQLTGRRRARDCAREVCG